MTILRPRTTDLGLHSARTRIARAAAFAWAERSQHRRLGSAFLSPERLHDIRASTRDSFGPPAAPQRDPDRR